MFLSKWVGGRGIKIICNIGQQKEIRRVLLLVDDGILLYEPGAKVTLLICVELFLGHLVPWHGELLSELGR